MSFRGTGVVALLLVVSCEQRDPKETKAIATTRPRATATATASASTSASATAVPAPSASIDPACPEPWILLELLPSGKRDAANEARKVLENHPELRPCKGKKPRAGGEICLLYVHFYGSKHFSPEKLHLNRDAIVARCFHPDDCRLLTERYGATAAETKCRGAIPTSGSIEHL